MTAPTRTAGARRPADDKGIVNLVAALRRADAECEVVLPWRQRLRVGTGRPRFELVLNNDRLLRSRITGLSLGRAYVQGDVDIEVYGHDDPKRVAENAIAIFDIRDAVPSGVTAGQALRFAGELALSRPTRVNARAVQHHYSLGDDFYHTFLDPDYHFYSQCIFDEGDELETEAMLRAAAARKLEHMTESLDLKAGMRILDVGAGWGGLSEYCSGLDVHVTSLTISQDSEKYVEDLIRDKGLRGEVLLEDVLEHRRREYYDAVVVFGVMEHIPTYRRFARRAWDMLKPGGRVYVDASATTQKYAASAFTRRYTWRGPHSCLALPDLQEELLFAGFEIDKVLRGTRDYERTMRAWALRFDANHDYIARRWGEYVYRTFRVFLWGGVHGFRTNRLQAYTLVAERRKDPGPRPGWGRRAGYFFAGLR